MTKLSALSHNLTFRFKCGANEFAYSGVVTEPGGHTYMLTPGRKYSIRLNMNKLEKAKIFDRFTGMLLGTSAKIVKESMRTNNFKIVPSIRIKGIGHLCKMTGYSRYHIQKCVKGERKASLKLTALLKQYGIAI